MKCPKCAYLGFETGDRCKNCGYDFSLLSAPDSDEPHFEDLSLRPVDDFEHRDPWLENRHDPLGGKHGPEPSTRDNIDDGLSLSLTPESPFADEAIRLDDPDFDEPTLAAPLAATPSAAPPAASPMTQFAAAASREAALPLFNPSDDEDDEPLIKLPATPRPPLAVRRTPDTPRLRAVPRPVSRPSLAPVLQFSEDPVDDRADLDDKIQSLRRPPAGIETQAASRPAARLIGAAIDYAILLGIDLGVVYFTLRMAGLSMSEWSVLPPAPMLAFLALLKVAYFYSFTAVGGQTIGKMAAGTCVIADNGAAVDAARAMRRTCAGVLSFLLLGLGFVPALFGDHRALHDRLAGTRVVRLRSV